MQRGRRGTSGGRGRHRAPWAAALAAALAAVAGGCSGPTAGAPAHASGDRVVPKAGGDEPAPPTPAPPGGHEDVPADFGGGGDGDGGGSGSGDPPAGKPDDLTQTSTPTPPAEEPGAEHLPPPARRAALSGFLDDAAAKALKARQYGRAVSLYRGLVAARGPADAAAL